MTVYQLHTYHIETAVGYRVQVYVWTWTIGSKLMRQQWIISNNLFVIPLTPYHLLTRHPSLHRLVEEVGEISETVESLQNKLRMAENALQELLRTKASLEQDLSIKNNSIFIDREKCLGMRKTFPMSPRVVSV